MFNVFSSRVFSGRPLRAFGLTALCLITLACSYFRVFEVYELQTYDWRCQLRGSRPVSKDIAIIEIEEITLENIGQWPFDRQYHAQLIDRLQKLGAKAVVFDVLFVEPSKSDALVSQIAKSAGNVYFAEAYSEPVNKRGRFTAPGVEAPLLEDFRKPARGVGYVNVKPDVDGKRRKIYPVMSYDGKSIYHLSLKVAMDALGVREDQVRLEPGRALHLGSVRLPLDNRGYFLVNYADKWRLGFKHYSYVQVLYAYEQLLKHEKPIIDVNELKGKICFVGLSALGSHDTSPVPIQAVYPMMGLYANLLNSILEKDFIARAGGIPNLLILIVISLWILYVSRRLKPLSALAVTATTMTVFAISAVALFVRFGIWIDVFYPLLVFTVIYTTATMSRALFEIKKRELIEGELKIASSIQQSFLPQTLPQAKAWSLSVFMKPAKQVGGDLYAFIPLGEGRLGVMLGDVSGKGTPAALFMAKVVSEFKYSARDHLDPAEVLTALNESIVSEATGGLFVTLTYVIFDSTSRKLTLASAGHLPTVCVRAGGTQELLEVESGMPIGVMTGVSFTAQSWTLSEGDSFALYSDGISEARNRRRDEYSIDRLQQKIAEFRHGDAERIVGRVVEDLKRFTGKAEQHDDITLIVVKIERLG